MQLTATSKSPALTATPNTTPLPRLSSIDIFRGVIMAWMALDHTRDFFTNIPFEPGTLSQTNLVLFATRWVTHFCAPMFFFLAGTGAFLYGQRKSPSELHHFLWLMWLTVVVILYFPCRWFAVLKQRRKDWWLSYL